MTTPTPDQPSPEIVAMVEKVARDAAAILAEQPEAVLAGVVHERGTLEWKQLRVMIAQATGQEVTDNLICGVLDRPIVFDLLRRGGGQQYVEILSRLVSRPGRWLPVLVVTKDGMFRTCAVELP